MTSPTSREARPSVYFLLTLYLFVFALISIIGVILGIIIPFFLLFQSYLDFISGLIEQYPAYKGLLNRVPFFSALATIVLSVSLCLKVVKWYRTLISKFKNHF